MNAPNSKDVESKKSISKKVSPFLEFNKKLDAFMSDIKSKSSSPEINPKENGYLKNNGNQLNKTPIDNNSLFNLNLEEKNQNSIDEAQLIKAKHRINFEKFMNCDQFAENYILEPSMNFDNNNNNCDLPYSQIYEDSILLKDESIFFVFDNVYKNKFLSKEDISKFKKEDIKLNFGKDPYEIYEQISQGKISPHDKTSIEFYNSLNNFNIFKTRNPYFMNIKMTNQNESEDDYFNMINNNNFNKINEQDENYEYIHNDSLNSTRHNSKTNPNNSSFIFNEKDLFLNNDKIFKKEGEKIEGKEYENNLDNKYIGKKRKNKKYKY